VDALLFPANLRAADRIHPEWQDLAVGDRILDGAPETGCHFVVRELAAERHLVLHSTSHLPASFRRRYGAWLDWSWTFVLRGLGDGRTRFHFRSRARLGPRWLALAYRAALIPAGTEMPQVPARPAAVACVSSSATRPTLRRRTRRSGASTARPAES
jgi:proline iminopeptidase